MFYYSSNRIETIFVKNVSFYTRGWIFLYKYAKKEKCFYFFF